MDLSLKPFKELIETKLRENLFLFRKIRKLRKFKPYIEKLIHNSILKIIKETKMAVNGFQIFIFDIYIDQKFLNENLNFSLKNYFYKTDL
jgi:hypothetical protein